jgi:hypothetical protein
LLGDIRIDEDVRKHMLLFKRTIVKSINEVLTAIYRHVEPSGKAGKLLTFKNTLQRIHTQSKKSKKGSVTATDMLAQVFTQEPNSIKLVVETVQKKPPSMLTYAEGSTSKYLQCKRPKSTFISLLKKEYEAPFLVNQQLHNDTINSARSGNVLLDMPYIIQCFPPRSGQAREKTVLAFASTLWSKVEQLLVPGVKEYKLHIAIENYRNQPEGKMFVHKLRGAQTTVCS